MNETIPNPGPATGSEQQQAPPPHQDLDRLRRSTSDRYVAGVAGGLGRHFNLDPTIVRVLLAVLTLFGGAGVLLYAVCWIFVPEDGKDRAPIQIGSDARKILLLAAAGVAFLLAMGDAFSGFNAGWPIASVAVVVGVVLIARDRKAERNAVPSSYDATVPMTPDVDATARFEPGFAATESMAPVPPAPPAPPTWQPPILPSHPKRTGIIWFWPTLAMIAIGLGILGLIDSTSLHVVPAAYPHLALGIVGLMLLVGAFYGRPGGLILLGFVSSAVLSVAVVLGGFNFSGRSIEVAPTSAAAVQPSYSTHNGKIVLDLTQVLDPAALAGRTLDLDLQAGEIKVIVPRSLNVDIHAALGFAGAIRVPGYDGGGVQDSVTRHLVGNPASTNSPLDLELDARVGQITVEQR